MQSHPEYPLRVLKEGNFTCRVTKTRLKRICVQYVRFHCGQGISPFDIALIIYQYVGFSIENEKCLCFRLTKLKYSNGAECSLENLAKKHSNSVVYKVITNSNFTIGDTCVVIVITELVYFGIYLHIYDSRIDRYLNVEKKKVFQLERVTPMLGIYEDEIDKYVSKICHCFKNHVCTAIYCVYSKSHDNQLYLTTKIKKQKTSHKRL